MWKLLYSVSTLTIEIFPTLYQMALDTLSISVMSIECERVFSSARKLLTPARDNLQEDIIEATECFESLVG
jgi:hypothetical protein